MMRLVVLPAAVSATISAVAITLVCNLAGFWWGVAVAAIVIVVCAVLFVFEYRRM